MLVETHDRLQNPEVVTATRVVVKDDHGRVLACVLELEPGSYYAGHFNDKEFPIVLRRLGIDQTRFTISPCRIDGE